MSFLPDTFQLPTPFHSRLRVKHGTDGQTDKGHQCFMPHPNGVRAL